MNNTFPSGIYHIVTSRKSQQYHCEHEYGGGSCCKQTQEPGNHLLKNRRVKSDACLFSHSANDNFVVAVEASWQERDAKSIVQCQACTVPRQQYILQISSKSVEFYRLRTHACTIWLIWLMSNNGIWALWRPVIYIQQRERCEHEPENQAIIR